VENALINLFAHFILHLRIFCHKQEYLRERERERDRQTESRVISDPSKKRGMYLDTSDPFSFTSLFAEDH
jgi:hypothetical protein